MSTGPNNCHWSLKDAEQNDIVPYYLDVAYEMGLKAMFNWLEI